MKLLAESARRGYGRSAIACATGILLAVAACTSAAPNPGATVASSPSAGSAAGSQRPTSASSGLEPKNSEPVKSARSTTSAPGRADVACVEDRCYELGRSFFLAKGVAPESSGIAASASTPGVFFVVDDGPGVDRIDAVRSNGTLMARIRVEGMSAKNTEALSAGPCRPAGPRCLYIGDIGDNDARRRHITVYRIPEPSVAPAPTVPVAADTWNYTYRDGAHNAEAMVIRDDGSVVVITKPAVPEAGTDVPLHRIYSGPPGGGTLRFTAAFQPPRPVVRLQSLLTGNVVTDASYSDGRMLLLTYDQVIEYRAPTRGADPATFFQWPSARLPTPTMIQSEGITADIAGCGYEVTSEQGPGGTQSAVSGVSCH